MPKASTFSGLIIAVILVGMLGTTASADIVRLRSGRTVHGEVTRSQQGGVEVQLESGISVSFPPHEVLKVIPENKDFLWKVNSDTATVYLFGTVHVGKSSFYPLAPAIEKAFARSSVLALEIDEAHIDPMYAYEMTMEAGTYTDGTTLKDHVRPQTYKRFLARLKKMHLAIGDFKDDKPWYAAMQLSYKQLGRYGYNQHDGVEEYLLRKAAGSKKVIGLEPLWKHLSYMNDIKNQDLFLSSTLQEMDDVEKFMGVTLAAWKKGDAATGARLFLTDVSEDPDLEAIENELLFKRNARMAQKIEKFLSTHKIYFVAVGAAHMVGQKGIVAILKKQGYRVRQL